MTNLDEARKRWLIERSQYDQFARELAKVLKSEIQRAGIWAEVTSRAKEIDSLIRKLIRKPGQTYETLGDKAGVRVIVRYKEEVNRVLEIANRVFELENVENTRDRLKLDRVGYQSVHATIKYRTNHPNADRYPPQRFTAELQARTLAQHLWADMAHDTVYKNDEILLPLPNPLKRRIYILAGVVELADEEFDRIEQEIPLVPELEILKALERHHYKLTTRRWDPEISLDVIRLLYPLYGKTANQVITHLEEFYLGHEDVLRDVFEKGERLADRGAFLFQPEALMIYDLLETDTLAVRRVWNKRYPEKELERVANAFGISFD